MSFLGRLGVILLAAMSLGLVAGCAPSDQSQADEEKEPHFVLGNNRFNAMDYPGAIDAFQQSLEVNPRSAQAHYRLAQLFDSKESDPAAAIFHYQEYLRLDPQADNPDIIRQRISTCKQQLAADVLPLPSAPATMKQIEDLTEKNRQLQQQVDDMTATLKKWNDYYNNQVANAHAAPPARPDAPIMNQGPDDMTAGTAQNSNPGPEHSSTSSTSTSTPSPHPTRTRTHLVAAGETMASIARKAGVSLMALQAANPGVTPRHLHVGQSLNLPSS